MSGFSNFSNDLHFASLSLDCHDIYWKVTGLGYFSKFLVNFFVFFIKVLQSTKTNVCQTICAEINWWAWSSSWCYFDSCNQSRAQCGLAFCFCFIEIIDKVFKWIRQGFLELEILKTLKNAVFVVKFISNNVDSRIELIAQDSNLIVKGDETDSFEWIIFLDFLELRLDGTQNALLSGDKCFILILLAGHPVELSLISRFHELSEHIKFFLTHTKFKIDFSLDFWGCVHTAWYVDTENHSFIFFGFVLLFEFTLHHVHNVLLLWDFLLFNVENIGLITELTDPQRFMGLELDVVRILLFF